MDKDDNGKVDFNEFLTVMKDAQNRPPWLFKAAALSDQVEEDT
jgi:Ca2+-binding EF-hand superfamily protein